MVLAALQSDKWMAVLPLMMVLVAYPRQIPAANGQRVGFWEPEFERMVDRNWSVKVEYDYVRLGGGGSSAYYVGTNPSTNALLRGVAIQPPGSATIGGRAFDNVVSIGINYHLH